MWDDVYIDRNYVFTFGKYKQQHIDDVLKDHPDYILWCEENLAWVHVSSTILKLANDYVELKKEYRERNL